jgi:hypothetical protein
MHNDASGRDQGPGSSQGPSIRSTGRLLLPLLPRYLGSNYGHEGETSLELLDTHHCQICCWISHIKGEPQGFITCGKESCDKTARELRTFQFLLIENTVLWPGLRIEPVR